MASVEIYTTPTCGFCMMAKRLLKRKGAAFTEIVALDPATRSKMIERSGGRRTVPQVFIDGLHIGGFDDLNALDQRGGLEPLLAR